MKAKKSFNPETIRRWITVIVAVLSALAGAITEASTQVIAAVI